MSNRNKLQLYGFNNLTKSLSFSLYKLNYILSSDDVAQYHQLINTRYSAEKLTLLLSDISHAIGGNILNIAKQEYSPQGASVTMMISEEASPTDIVTHLDKSHLCVHTYPEDRITNQVAIFRADIELSTCGVISPLKVVNQLLSYFDADIIDIDYRIRGMTRDEQGVKHFTDETINNISEVFSTGVLTTYQVKNHNLTERQLYFTQLVKNEKKLESFLFGDELDNLANEQRKLIEQVFIDEVNQLTRANKHEL